MAHFSPALTARGLATPHANPGIQIDLKSSSLFPSKIKDTCQLDVSGGNICKSIYLFFCSRHSVLLILSTFPAEDKQPSSAARKLKHLLVCVQFTKSAHIYVSESRGGLH